MYRSQLLLQQLGISQWIPREKETVQQPKGLLWRDQEDTAPVLAVPENLHNNLSSAAKHVNQFESDTTNALSVLKNATLKTERVAPTHQNNVSEQVITIDQSIVVEEQDYPQTIAFDCHLLIHEKFVLSAQIHTEDEQRLFNQIAKACYATSSFLQWPLAIDMWQMNDHVLKSYLKGVFANHQDKVFIHLGDVPFPVIETTFIAQKSCASLQQLLESADQKRALWQQLYPLVYNHESNNA